MTIAKTGDFVKNIAARKLDRGGNIMNLVSEIFVKLSYNDKIEKHKAEPNKIVEDYGYELYKSLEYDFKYLKNDDFRFRGNLLKISMR
jgi:hypothetical protein